MLVFLPTAAVLFLRQWASAGWRPEAPIGLKHPPGFLGHPPGNHVDSLVVGVEGQAGIDAGREVEVVVDLVISHPSPTVLAPHPIVAALQSVVHAQNIDRAINYSNNDN